MQSAGRRSEPARDFIDDSEIQKDRWRDKDRDPVPLQTTTRIMRLQDRPQPSCCTVEHAFKGREVMMELATRLRRTIAGVSQHENTFVPGRRPRTTMERIDPFV